MMQTIAFFLVFLGTFPGIIAQQCAGDYTTCCPAYDKKQVTISTKSYIVQCDKVIGPKTPVKAATPKACVDLCQGDSECVNAYWYVLNFGRIRLMGDCLDGTYSAPIYSILTDVD